jgi:ABC-type polysaccharide/polyol phosphate export permease
VSIAAVLAYVASAILLAWGTAHLAPTRAVVASFGAISDDNRRILVMEWMAEGITHVAIGRLVILATAIAGAGDPTIQLVYVVSAGVLVVLAGLTAVTGSRTPVIWFRVCPFVLTAAGALLVAASVA